MIRQMVNFSFLKRLPTFGLMVLLVACSGGDGGITLEGTGSVGALGLSWTVPSGRENPSDALNVGDIVGFRIYYGTDDGDYQKQVDITGNSQDAIKIEDIPAGTYYVVVTAIDSEGRESLYSNRVIITI